MLSPQPLPDQPGDAAAILASLLDGLSAPPGSPGQPPPRDAVLGVFRRYLTRLQHHVQQGFEAGGMSGLQSGRLLGRLTDGVIAALFGYARLHAAGAASDLPNLPDPEEPMAVVATGGYGRGVLAPFSDIDLLFITARHALAGARFADGRVHAVLAYGTWASRSGTPPVPSRNASPRPSATSRSAPA